MRMPLKIAIAAVAVIGIAAVAYQGALSYYGSRSTVDDWPHDLAAAKERAAVSGRPLLVKVGMRG